MGRFLTGVGSLGTSVGSREAGTMNDERWARMVWGALLALMAPRAPSPRIFPLLVSKTPDEAFALVAIKHAVEAHRLWDDPVAAALVALDRCADAANPRTSDTIPCPPPANEDFQ